MAMKFKTSEKIRNKKKLLYYIGAAFFLALWIGGLLAQMGGSVGNMFTDEKVQVRFNPISCILANFTIGPHGLFFVLVGYCVIGFYLYRRYKDKHRVKTEDDERGFQIEGSGVYGTSRLLKPEEVKERFAEVEPLERTSGTILGKFITEDDPTGKNHIVSIPPDGKRYKYDSLGRIATIRDPQTGERSPQRIKLGLSNGNNHVMVTGTSGCGKSHCYARPKIFQCIRFKRSYIVTDPKGELYADTSKYAEKNGYIVKILNLTYLTGSDSWDALAEVKGGDLQREAQTLCDTIINNTSNPNAKAGDEVYSNGEQNLLKALVLYVLTSPQYGASGGKKTLGGVYELLCKTEEDLDACFNTLPEGNPALAPWNIYRTASNNLRGNLKLGLGVRLQTLQDEVVKMVTGTPDIDLTQPGKTQCAYYIIMSDMHSAYRFISSLFFSLLFDKLVEYSRTLPSQKLPVPVDVIMDEFIAIGQIPSFADKLATVRSAGIGISIIFQTLSQLQNSYPDGVWESLIANCYTFMCLSCNDMTTAKYLSERSGTATVALENMKVDRPAVSLGNAPSTVSHTYSVGQRAVLQPAEIISLSSEGKALVSIAGADLFAIDKFPYTDMIDPASLEVVNMYDHIPSWVLQRQSSTLPHQPVQPIEPYTPRKSTQRKGRQDDNEFEDEDVTHITENNTHSQPRGTRISHTDEGSFNAADF